MFKFLKIGRRKPEPVIESQRETFTRLVEELNSAIDALSDKPAVTIDPATGRVSFELPEQFPDEALALPAPEKKTEDAEAQSDLPDAETSDDVAPDAEKLDEKAA
ncbi:MAG: hypothetical protein ACWA47_08210 [Brevirhabdus sp.]